MEDFNVGRKCFMSRIQGVPGNYSVTNLTEGLVDANAS